MRIDCRECEMYRSDHCDDCLVSAVLHPPSGPVEIDDDIEPSVGALAHAGLVPVLKFRPRGAPGRDGTGAPAPAGRAADTG